MKADVILLLLLALLFFSFGICFGQVSVVQFNSEWNESNTFDISSLKDCEKSDVVICHKPEQQKKHNIKAVPTVIVFDSGIEVVRFEANIMMQLEATHKDIQGEIDKIYMTKFE